MIEISQQDFENRIQEVIDGKISRKNLAKELHTDLRTLNNQIIQRISVCNPDLYIDYIKKYPYKQKERDDLDYEALVIEMIIDRTHTQDVANKYNVSVRTIQRRVNQLEEENPYLIEIYKQVKKKNLNNTPLPENLQRQVSELIRRPVKINEKNTTRKQQLEEIEKVFNNRCKYVSKQEAADSMGISMNRVYKLLNELYRMNIEENYNKMDKSFKESLKVEGITKKQILNDESRIKTQIQKEGVEK